jgi:dTDP-4-amino-4,6-dideoxygalactose transaminase
VQALVEAGLRCRFYEATASLAPDQDELDSLLGPRVRALHLVHYLGFPQDAPRWRNWCDERGLLLIEDAAQSWLASWEGRPVGSFGDLAIFCVYKSFGVPDGALLVSSRPAGAPGGQQRSGVREVLARHRQWLQQFAGRPLPPEPVEPYDPALDFAMGDLDAPPYGLSVTLLPKVLRMQAAPTRRRNYRYLLERLPGTAAPPFGHLPEGAVPFVFPVASADKAGLLRRLRGHGIGALDFWSVPHPSLPAEQFPRASALRASVVGLPVHQELRQASLRRMVTALWSTHDPVAPA